MKDDSRVQSAMKELGDKVIEEQEAIRPTHENIVLLNVDSTILKLGNSDLTDSVGALQPALTDIATIATKTMGSDPHTADFVRSDGQTEDRENLIRDAQEMNRAFNEIDMRETHISMKIG